MSKLLNHLEAILKTDFIKKETMQVACNLSHLEMEEIYSTAYNLYQNDHLEQAEEQFRLLVTLNPFTVKYWSGLAASLQMLEKYDQALHAYATCTLLEEKNPYPHLYACECYMALNDREEAKKALECAEALVDASKNYSELTDEINSLKRAIS